MKYKYKLGVYRFTSWAKVKEYARHLLSKGRYKLKDNDLAFVKDLLEYHPHAKEKKEHGVAVIEVGPDRLSGSTCFKIVTDNGERVEFSYRKCKPESKRSIGTVQERNDRENRITAYRNAIRYQTKAYLLSCMDRTCAHCGSAERIEVDHLTISLRMLANLFEQEYKPEKYPPTVRDGRAFGSQVFSLEHEWERDFVDAWKQFHSAYADYQLLCGTCNSRKGGDTNYKPYLNDRGSGR